MSWNSHMVIDLGAHIRERELAGPGVKIEDLAHRNGHDHNVSRILRNVLDRFRSHTRGAEHG